MLLEDGVDRRHTAAAPAEASDAGGDEQAPGEPGEGELEVGDDRRATTASEKDGQGGSRHPLILLIQQAGSFFFGKRGSPLTHGFPRMGHVRLG